MDDQQQSRRWRIGRLVLWTVGVVVAVSTVVFVINRFFVHHPLWDWLELLIVPAVLAGGGLWFNRQQRARELAIASQQRKQEVEIADQRAQDEALQAYLDQIGQLLLDKDRPLRQSKEGDEVQTLARARTLTVLTRLKGERKGSVVRFLYESGLITKDHLILDLRSADLSCAYLRGAQLYGANLKRADLSGANLREAGLSRADLFEADLSGANLSEAVLSETKLSWANLSEANLHEAHMRDADLLRADLREADLREADLSYADLKGADLSCANLRGANLSEVDLVAYSGHRINLSRADLGETYLVGGKGPTDEQLEQAKTLEGATMPNRQKYEDWLKDKEGR